MRRKLGQMEGAILLTYRKIAPFNVCTTLRLGNRLSTEHLEAALTHVMQSHPLLRSCIIAEGKDHFFETFESAPVPLEVIARQSEDHWLSVVEQYTFMQFGEAQKPLWRCVYVDGDSDSELIFVVHHIIADKDAIITLIDEVLSAYARLSKGESLPAPPKTDHLLPPAEENFPNRFHGWRLASSLIPFMGRQLVDEVHYQASSRHYRQTTTHEQPSPQIMYIDLTEDETSALSALARRKRVSMSSALQAAMLLAFNKRVCSDAPTIHRTMSATSIRPYLEPPMPHDTLGSYIVLMRVTVFVDPQAGFWQLAEDIHHKIYQSSKRGDKFLFSLVQKRMMSMLIRMWSMRMMTTALSFSGVDNIKTQYGDVTVKALHGIISSNALGPEYAMRGGLFDGRLTVDISTLDTDMDRQTMTDIAEDIRTTLTHQIGG